MSHSWLEQQIAAANQGKIGLIDIGSNSIRLVVFDRLKRAPSSIYNERVMCQLGKGIAISGKLNPAGVKLANDAIGRFVALAKNMEVTELDIVATAAVREADDGQHFVDALERTHNIHIEVISGKREAKLGAYAILASMHKPVGLMGDLGGGSLELAEIDEEQRIGERVSLPIGGLRLLDQCTDADDIRQTVRGALESVDWLAEQQGHSFYAIGGSFRSVAQMHMHQIDYPLPLTHDYTIETNDAQKLLGKISGADAKALSKMPGVSKKRVPILSAASIIMEELIKLTNPEVLTFSATGIREGYLYEKLSPFIREEDALIASCIEIAGKQPQSLSYAGELFGWVQHVLKKQSEGSMRVAYACCLMQDIARHIHADHRSEWAFRRIIQSNLNGLSHKQRVQLALTLYHRYQFKLKHEFDELDLLDNKSRHWARLVGTIASLAHHLSGGIAGTLPDIELEIGEESCELHLPSDMESLMGEVIEKRLNAIAEAHSSWHASRS